MGSASFCEERLRVATEALQLGSWDWGTWDWDLASDRSHCNPYHQVLLGYSPEQPILTFEDWKVRVYREDLPGVLEKLNRAIEGHTDYEAEYRVERPDGSLRWILSKGRAVYDASGAAQRMSGSCLDITDRKVAEEKLQELARLLDLTCDAILVRDAEDRITFWNRGAEILYGWSKEEALGKMARELIQIRNPISPVSIGTMLEEKGYWEGELTHVKRDGTPVVVASRWVLDRDRKRVLETNTNVTSRKESENELKRHADELARSNAELEQFAYVASHDMKEPLRMVKTFAQLLAKGYSGKLGPEADECIGFIVEGAGRMGELIDDLLTFSKAGKNAEPVKETDANELVAKARGNLHASIEEHGALVTTDRLPMVWGDSSQLLQLFQNLIANAIKFKSANEKPLVHVSVEKLDGFWRFSVRDNGIGIDPAHRERIFTMFQRLHTRSEYPGSGIGLAICKKIAERHGGRIWVESEVGKGSLFHFTLRETPAGVKH